MQKDKTRDKLLRLLLQGQKHTQSQLAKELGVRQSAISKQLKRMEKRGWVMGHGATSNRYFELTKNGISAAQNPSQNGISRASKPEKWNKLYRQCAPCNKRQDFQEADRGCG